LIVLGYSSSILIVLGDTFPEILMVSAERERQTKVARGNQPFSGFKRATISQKRYEIRPKLLLMTNRKLNIHF